MPRQADWTPEEIEREERATRARVQRDAARPPAENIREMRALTAFANRLAEAGKKARDAARP